MQLNLINGGRLDKIHELLIRCTIPECENGTDLTYNPSWLSKAVPFESSSPAKCARYAPYENGTSNNCSASDFNTQQTLSCESYVYRTEEVTIVQDVSTILKFTKIVSLIIYIFVSTISNQNPRAPDHIPAIQSIATKIIKMKTTTIGGFHFNFTVVTSLTVTNELRQGHTQQDTFKTNAKPFGISIRRGACDDC